MRVLLDTSLFVAAYRNGIDSLPVKAQRIVSDPNTERLISVISLVEVAIKTQVSRGLVFPLSAVEDAIQEMRLTLVPYTSAHAQALFSLPFFADHRDPFDRMLIATAIEEEVPILTSDRQFKRYKPLTTIWR